MYLVEAFGLRGTALGGGIVELRCRDPGVDAGKRKQG